jgi:hypothetical protein
VTTIGASLPQSRRSISLAFLAAALANVCCAQEGNPPVRSKPAPSEQNAAQIELLETKYRFERNGDSRKEVHARVRINSELGARQFARLNFDFNCSFQSVEIPVVRITHASGGIADILPSAITDNPNPAVVNAPAYSDVRVKSVRILGLQPSDLLEYRVITITTHHPFAPDFWLDHSFDRSGVVSQETFLIDAPAERLRIHINPDTPAAAKKSGEGDAARVTYRWDLEQVNLKSKDKVNEESPDVALTTFSSWCQLSGRIGASQPRGFVTTIFGKAEELGGFRYSEDPTEALYDLVSHKITTINPPFELSLSIRRTPADILESGYATSEEKVRLLSILMSPKAKNMKIVMYGQRSSLENELPHPSLLSGMLLRLTLGAQQYFLDPGLEVAPFGLVSANLRGRKVLNISQEKAETDDCFTEVPANLPFPAVQQVKVNSDLASDGKLKAKVRYSIRGDNELLLRVAFHQTPQEKWKEVAQMLALSDGFRGQVTQVTASDPYATKEPFTVEYEISQPQFVDWSKKPIRIPALLPLAGLPDPPAANAAKEPIKLGTPLAIELEASVQLPEGTAAQPPIGTSVKRDYATFSSKYSARGNVLHASRSLHFILSELPASRASDFHAFLHAVQSDQAQFFTLQAGQK